MDESTTVIALRGAIQLANGPSAFARALTDRIRPRGFAPITPAHVYNWINRDKKVPTEFCPDIEALWGVPCEDLRPDVAWSVIRGSAVSQSEGARMSVSAAVLILYGSEAGEGGAALAVDPAAPSVAPGCELVFHDRNPDGGLPESSKLPFQDLHLGDERRVCAVEGLSVIHVLASQEPLGLGEPGDGDQVQLSWRKTA
jgi:DNA-binding transcriptional regulator YdaS (Cro superfamily)